MSHSSTKITAISMLGTLFSWLEYASFGSLIPIIATLFFPANTPELDSLHTLMLVLSLYIIRPLGAIIFGFIGDTQGRKRALGIAVFLMGISSLALSYLPTYAQVGMLAPILLIACRMLQGIAISGEMNGTSVFLVEHANKHFPHLASSWSLVAIGVGLLLGYLFPTAINHKLLLEWGWRMPFLFGAVSCIVFSYLRIMVSETPTFIDAKIKKELPRNPLWELLCHHKIRFIQALLISSFFVVYISVCALYYNQFLVHTLEYQPQNALWLISIGIMMLLALIPIIGIIADRIGGVGIALMGLAGCSITAPLLFMSGPTYSTFILTFVEGFFAFFTASASVPLFYMQIKLFPARVRYTAISLSWGISLSLFSATTLKVSDHLWQLTHWSIVPALLASVSAIIMFGVVLTLHRSVIAPQQLVLKPL